MIVSTIIRLLGLALLPLNSASPLQSANNTITTTATTSAQLSPRFVTEWSNGPITCSGPILGDILPDVFVDCVKAINRIANGDTAYQDAVVTWYDPAVHAKAKYWEPILYFNPVGQCTISLKLVDGLAQTEPYQLSRIKMQEYAQELTSECLWDLRTSGGSAELYAGQGPDSRPSGIVLTVATIPDDAWE